MIKLRLRRCSDVIFFYILFISLENEYGKNVRNVERFWNIKNCNMRVAAGFISCILPIFGKIHERILVKMSTWSWSSLLLDSLLLSSGDELKSMFSNCCDGSEVACWSSIVNCWQFAFGFYYTLMIIFYRNFILIGFIATQTNQMPTMKWFWN